MSKTKIVISGVNLLEGGQISVLHDCLSALEKLQALVDVTVLVHKKSLINTTPGFKLLEFPLIKKSWFNRVKFEYFQSREISEQIKPDLWISLHDMTPNVVCKKQLVYCHNPSPFYKIRFKEAVLDPKFFLFNKFYIYLYSINIKRNNFVIVQQDWLRSEFKNRFGVETIVARPATDFKSGNKTPFNLTNSANFKFFYPSFPRIFKNFQVLLDASNLLSKKRKDFEVLLTIDGSENRYSNQLLKKYSTNQQIKFIGKQSREKVFELYNDIDCLVFPSKLETWGLPLTEVQEFHKPILASNLPFAFETVGEYEKVNFFNPDSAEELAVAMEQLMNGNLQFYQTKKATPKAPYFNNWVNLFSFLINDNK